MYLQGSAGVMFLSQGRWSYHSHRENLTHNITSELITTLSTPIFFFLGFFPKANRLEREQSASVRPFKVQLSQS